MAQVGDEITWIPGGGIPEIARVPNKKTGTYKTSPPRVKAHHSAGMHVLLADAKAAFLTGSESRWGGYLTPAKRLLPDIQVTKATVDYALGLANELFRELDHRGHRVTLASVAEQIHRPVIETREHPTKQYCQSDLWSPARRTVLYLNGTAVGLALFEMTEPTQMRYVDGRYVKEKDYATSRHLKATAAQWISTQDIPCGRFAVLAYASFYDKKWQKTWKEAKNGEFQHKIAWLAGQLESCEDEARNTIELGRASAHSENIRCEAMRVKWQTEQQERRLQESLNESKDALEAIISAHAGRERIEAFLDYMKTHREQLSEANRMRLDYLTKEVRSLFPNASLDEFLAWRPPVEKKA